MSKAITSGQARHMISSFTVDTPWEEIDVDLQSFIELPPKERGERFAHFLKFGCAVARQPSKLASEPMMDFLVRVDRSVKPSYPDWMKKVMHPELELAGPAEYDLQTGVREWLHENQKHWSLRGTAIYGFLKQDNGLATCLNLQDGLAIQQKGIAVFRKLFADKAVFLWGSVVQHRHGNLDVPCLIEDNDEVIVHWYCLDNDWHLHLPALRFSK